MSLGKLFYQCLFFSGIEYAKALGRYYFGIEDCREGGFVIPSLNYYRELDFDFSYVEDKPILKNVSVSILSTIIFVNFC